jgi:hypothetical protein
VLQQVVQEQQRFSTHQTQPGRLYISLLLNQFAAGEQAGEVQLAEQRRKRHQVQEKELEGLVLTKPLLALRTLTHDILFECLQPLLQAIHS